MFGRRRASIKETEALPHVDESPIISALEAERLEKGIRELWGNLRPLDGLKDLRHRVGCIEICARDFHAMILHGTYDLRAPMINRS